MKAMETIQDLIEEAKLRTVWWGLCIFSVTYFLTYTSKSMWMNLPMAILIFCGLRILSNQIEYQIEFRWKVVPSSRQSQFLSNLKKKRLSMNDPRLSTVPPPPSWKKKIDSPVVEAAISDFIDKILNEFVINLWYSQITPDKEAPELIRGVIMDVLGEISVRVKDINIFMLLSRCRPLVHHQTWIGYLLDDNDISDYKCRKIVDLIGEHLEMFRRNHAAIGTDVMKRLSSDGRDERLKYHLMTSGELYPALMSPESEYKVLQKIVAGILSVVVGPREAQCPLVRTIAREIVTCLLVQPVLKLACPERISDGIINAIENRNREQFSGEKQNANSASSSTFDNQAKNVSSKKVDEQKTPSIDNDRCPELQHSADWARLLEVATQRRTEVLTPENLENMWTKGRYYKKKYKKCLKKDSSVSNSSPILRTSTGVDEKGMAQLPPRRSVDKQSQAQRAEDYTKSSSFEGGGSHVYEVDVRKEFSSDGNKNRLKRSNSTSDLNKNPETRLALLGVGEGPLITEFYTTDFIKHNENYIGDNKSPSNILHVNVDDDMDDITRQFKGVSDGLMRKVVGSPLEENEQAPARHLSWSVHDINTHLSKEIATESNSSISDTEDIDKLGESTQGESRLDSEANGWHSDNELDSKHFPPKVVRRLGEPEDSRLEMENDFKSKSEVKGLQAFLSSDLQHSDPSTTLVQNPTVPFEWMPPNVSVPILNLVDKVFQLSGRDWLRRQVFWISKRILQIFMESTVDDWLLTQVRWLRSEDTVARGIRGVQDILWPNGKFFTKGNDSEKPLDETGEKTCQMAGQLGGMKVTKPSPFEQQLEASHRAHKIKKFLFDGAPTALVRVVGDTQYKKSVSDIFYFTQSNVCIKQLTFAILELLLRSVFPELRDLLRDIRENPDDRSE